MQDGEVARFRVETRARSKARPRFTRFGHAYTPQVTRDYEALIAKAARVAMDGRAPEPGAMAVAIRITFKTPKRRKIGAPCVGAPMKGADVDNLAKSILDGCNAIIWDDDGQVTRLIVTKHWAADDAVDVLVHRIQEVY